MNRGIIDLYNDYLLSSFGATTATSLSDLLEGSLSHDQITRFLSQQRFDSKTLWQFVKLMVCTIEDEAGVLIPESSSRQAFGDTIAGKALIPTKMNPSPGISTTEAQKQVFQEYTPGALQRSIRNRRITPLARLIRPT